MPLLIAFLAALLPFATPSAACECADRDPCELLESSEIIFLGETVSGGLRSDQDSWNPDTNYARLKVLERFRGVPEDVDTIEMGLWYWKGMGAQAKYRQGEKTLVYLRKALQGRLVDGLCSRSRILEDDDDEELRRVREYFAGETETHIRGYVLANGTYREFARGVPHATVFAARDGVRHESTTDEDGRYEIAGLSAGTYAVVPEKEGFRVRGGFARVKVKESGCTIQDLGLWARNSLSGNLLDPEGNPVAGINVFLQRADLPKGRWGRESKTRSDGLFSFQEIDPGPYRLAVSPQGVLASSPYEPAFYGGATSRSAAQLIHIESDSKITALSFTVGERYRTRVIRAKVVWPNGDPVGSQVSCEDATAEEAGYPYVGTDSTQDGAWSSCRVLAGRPYRIAIDTAPYVLPFQPLLEEREITIRAGPDDIELGFTLSSADYERSQRSLRSRNELRRRAEESERRPPR